MIETRLPGLTATRPEKRSRFDRIAGVLSFALIGVAISAAPIKAQDAPIVDMRVAANVSDTCRLVVDNREPVDWCWSLECGQEGDHDLGSGLSAMLHVADLVPSPDGRWLAVLSVGEGHPILEVVDLQQLLTTHEYRALATINPYPGTINIEHWTSDALLVTSDMPLPRMPLESEDPIAVMLPTQMLFSLDSATWEVR